MGKNISRAETDKERESVLLFVFFQARLIVYYEMHQFPWKISAHVLSWLTSFDNELPLLLSAGRPKAYRYLSFHSWVAHILSGI